MKIDFTTEDLKEIENSINQKLIGSMNSCGYVSAVDAVKIVSGVFELAQASDKKELNVDEYIGPSDFKEIYESLTRRTTK